MLQRALFFVSVLIINLYYVSGSEKCINGKNDSDVCHCYQCYTGPSCELIKNKRPTFTTSSYGITINDRTISNDILVKVTANDEDECYDCGCGQVVYSILEDSAKETFQIDPDTGEVRMMPDKSVPQGLSSFVVKATNKSPFDNTYDTATIFITLDKDNVTILERHRRDTSPVKVTFDLSQTFPTQNLTTIKIGQRLSFKIVITFPTGKSQVNLELFASETTNDPVLMICDVKIMSVGSDLTPNPAITISKQEGINGTIWPYTHIIFGTMNIFHNKPSPASLSTVQVVIVFDAVMLFSSTAVTGTTYYVSAGAEYINGTEIWVGQVGYVADMNTAKPNPQITLTGDTSIYPGRLVALDITIQAKEAYLGLNLGVYTPLNNSAALSLCVAKRSYVGIAYSCLPTNYAQPTLTNMTINNQLFYSKATMAVGVLTNRYYMEPITHTDIAEKTIIVKVVARTNPLIWLYSYYYIGVSISYANQVIYAGSQQYIASPAPPLIAYGSQIQYILGYDKAINTVNMGDSGRIVINLTIPTGTELDYNITSTFGTLAEICGVSLYWAGLNVPCMDQMNFTTTFVMSSDNYAIQATTSISGIRHIKISNDTNDDVLQLAVTFRPINDTRNAVGNSISGSVTITWTGGSGSEKKLPYTLTPPSVNNVNATTYLPIFTFSMRGNDGNVTVGESYQLYFAMRLQPGIIYSPTTLGFYMPFDTTVRIGMCSVAVTFVGKRILCFNQNFLMKKFNFSSKTNDPINFDQLTIPIGSLCSLGPVGIPATIDDEIQMVLTLIILSHSKNTIGATTNVNAGMMISPVQIWVGNQPIQIVAPAAVPNLASTNFPVIYGQRVDAPNNNIFKNDLAIIQYIIKTAPGVLTSMNLKITSDSTINDGFGVCQILMKSQGSSIPCVNGTITNTTWGPYSKYNKEALFQFTKILNTGTTPLVDSPAFDENSILVEVVVKFGTSISSSVKVTATLTFNTGTKTSTIQFDLQNSLSRFNGTPIGVEPTFIMYLSPLFNDTRPNISTVAYSESLRGVVSIQLRPGIFQSLKVIIASAPDLTNQMDVVSVNILSVGRNIPCLQTGMIPYVVQQRSNSLSKDLTSVDLGTVCHRQTLPNTTVEDDKIFVEAVFRVWKIPTGSPISLQLNTIALLNNDQVYVARIVFDSSIITSHINDINLLNQTITISAVPTTQNVNIGSIFTVNVTLFIPPYTQFKSGIITLYSENPTGSDSYYFVSGNVNFTGTFGNNIGINSNEPLPMTLKSTKNTTQMDFMSADLGVVQNTATTYRMKQNNFTGPSADDTFTIVISVKLTDNSMASNGKVITVVVGANFGSIVKNTTFDVKVVRTDLEVIDLNVSTALLTNQPIYTSGDALRVSAQAQMSNVSKLECRNFKIYVSAPPFILFSAIINSSYSSLGYAINQKNIQQGGFFFEVPYFFYTENISVVFSMSIIAALNLTRGRSESMITVPVIYACQTFNWPANPLGNKWFNKVDNLQFYVKGNAVGSTSCNNDLQLTDKTVIKDCAISAYMSPYASNDVLKIRSNSGSYWIPHVRGGQYNKLRYVDIRFGKLTTVSRVVITSPSSNKPLLISVYGTMDGRAFSHYKDLSLTFTGNAANVILSTPPFSYRGIRISIKNVTSNDQQTGINLDLFGCPTPNITDQKTFDPCVVSSFSKPTATIPEFYYRGYLNSQSYIFVCDEIASRTNALDTYPRCFRSNIGATPYKWEDLGNQVGKIIGFDSANSVIYGISSDLNGYIMSEDNAQTWTTLNGGGWRMKKSLSNLQVPTNLPWTAEDTFTFSTTGSACTKYSAGTLNICYDGIYSGSTNIYNWNDCCSN